MNTLHPNKRLILILAAIPVVLLIPFIGMQISDVVQWSGFDFAVVGILLLTLGLGIETVLRFIRTRQNRIILIATVLLLFALLYVELAVGIFGTPIAGS